MTGMILPLRLITPFRKAGVSGTAVISGPDYLLTFPIGTPKYSFPVKSYKLDF
jgi:hypothetical protein